MNFHSIKIAKTGTFTGHRDSVYALEASTAPNLFFSAAGDGLVVQWDLALPDRGELIARIPASIYALHTINHTGQLWVGQNFEGIHIIDLETRKEVRSVKITSAAIFDLKSHGQNVFVATGDGLVIVVDSVTGSVRKHIRATDKSARCLAVNPIRHELAVGYSDHSIRIYDLHNYTLKQLIPAHSNSVFTLQYTPDFRFLVSGSRDAHLKFWEAGQEYVLHQTIVAHMFAINHIAFSPDGRYFVTCSMDKSIKVWDAAARKLLKVIDRARYAGHGTSINKLLWSSYQDQILSGSDDRTISVWQFITEGKQNQL